MVATANRREGVRKHLDVFAETWQPDHAAGLQNRDVEDFLTEAVWLFNMMERFRQHRRDDVFRGVLAPDPTLDVQEQTELRRWLTAADGIGEVFASAEAAFGPLAGMEEFRQCRRAARTLLANWTPPVLARAVGARVLEVSEDGADFIHTLLKQPPRTRVGLTSG